MIHFIIRRSSALLSIFVLSGAVWGAIPEAEYGGKVSVVEQPGEVVAVLREQTPAVVGTALGLGLSKCKGVLEVRQVKDRITLRFAAETAGGAEAVWEAVRKTPEFSTVAGREVRLQLPVTDASVRCASCDYQVYLAVQSAPGVARISRWLPDTGEVVVVVDPAVMTAPALAGLIEGQFAALHAGAEHGVVDSNLKPEPAAK